MARPRKIAVEDRSQQLRYYYQNREKLKAYGRKYRRGHRVHLPPPSQPTAITQIGAADILKCPAGRLPKLIARYPYKPMGR